MVRLSDREHTSTIKGENAEACLEAQHCADVVVKVLDLFGER